MTKAWCTTITLRYERNDITQRCFILVSVTERRCNPLAQFKGKGRWVHWNDCIKNVSLGDKNTKVQEIIVPTIDTVRYTYLMDLCINYGVSVSQKETTAGPMKEININFTCVFVPTG